MSLNNEIELRIRSTVQQTIGKANSIGPVVFDFKEAYADATIAFSFDDALEDEDITFDLTSGDLKDALNNPVIFAQVLFVYFKNTGASTLKVEFDGHTHFIAPDGWTILSTPIDIGSENRLIIVTGEETSGEEFELVVIGIK